jgi:hypothetical protein
MGANHAPTGGRRTARQEAWHDVNAHIAHAADALSLSIGDADKPWTFLCECGLRDCAQMISATLGDYRAARLAGAYVVIPGHEDATDRIVERTDRYLVVVPD